MININMSLEWLLKLTELFKFNLLHFTSCYYFLFPVNNYSTFFAPSL